MPAAAAAATAPNTAGDAWCAAHCAKSAWLTVNALKRMFACDAPQYSAQCPFHTAAPSAESGVNQM